MRTLTPFAFLLVPVALLAFSGASQVAAAPLAVVDQELHITNPSWPVPKNAKELKEFRANIANQRKALEIKKFKSAEDRLKAEHRIESADRQLDIYDSKTVLGKLAADDDGKPQAATSTIFRQLFGREPDKREKEICLKHFQKKGRKRLEAIEDIVWAMVATREFQALMRNPLPPQLDTTKIDATFYHLKLRKEVSFKVPQDLWRNVTLPLLPAEVDPKPAKWESIGTLTIQSKTEGPVIVGLYAPSKGRGAFSVRLEGVKEKVYYRGGSSKALMEQLKEVYSTVTKSAKSVREKKSVEAEETPTKTEAKSE